MATVKLKASFDGVTDVARLDGQSAVGWDDRSMGHYSVWETDPTAALVADVTFKDGGWSIKTMHFGGAGLDNLTRIRDADAKPNRKIDYLDLGYNSDVVLKATRVLNLYGGDGDAHVVSLAESLIESVYSIVLFAARNTVTTGGGWVSNVFTGSRNGDGDTIIVGSGGVNSILTGQGDDKVVVNAGGPTGLITTGDGHDRVTVGNGYVGQIDTGKGKDTVKTGAQWVESVLTGDGKDHVTLGSAGVTRVGTGGDRDVVVTGTGGAGYITLDAGNDLLKVAPTVGGRGVRAQGSDGTDTINFTLIRSTGVDISLERVGTWQLLGQGDDHVGAVSIGQFENTVGTRRSDTLTGDDGDNTLTGKGGRDVLTGKGGDDLLIGNGGRDVFVFGPHGGNDAIRGFKDGKDRIKIVGTGESFASLTIEKDAGDLLIDYDGGTITLLGDAATTLTASDFIFA
ncbi:calcium-binding protein [Chachezhania sediminis]|uniref:hypothetical protein n=1 Tax=Chachezhania sediminis TaxID=2599291 RepID=UPI00131C85F5|nr:hypothetical protein [Chachezhania sediminis]